MRAHTHTHSTINNRFARNNKQRAIAVVTLLNIDALNAQALALELRRDCRTKTYRVKVCLVLCTSVLKKDKLFLQKARLSRVLYINVKRVV